MRRSSSMESAVSILDKAPASHITIFRSSEDDDYPPAPLPLTPEPPLSARSNSTSVWSVPSPRSFTGLTFPYSNKPSPGISLVSSTFDLDGNEGRHSNDQMATVDVRMDTSVNNGPFYGQSGSVESLEEEVTSSIGDDIGRSGIPLSRASQPSLHYDYENEEGNQLNDSHRCKSLDNISKAAQNDRDSSYSSLDKMRRGSNASSNNNNDEKDSNYPLLGQLAYEIELQDSFSPSDYSHNEEDSPLETTAESDSLDTSDPYLTASPGSQEFKENSRVLELPAIREENEEAFRSRRSSMHDSPDHDPKYEDTEPIHIAPGAFTGHISHVINPNQVHHRRVVSDTVIPYKNRFDESSIKVESPPSPSLIRDAPGRASKTARCMSHGMLNTQEEIVPGPATSDRSLSKSDTSIDGKEKADDYASPIDDLDEVPTMYAPTAPPPVVLTRKNSVVKNSWQGYFHHGAIIPHTVVTPTTAGQLQYSSTRPKLGSTETISLEDSPPSGLSRSSSGSSVVAFVRRSFRRLSGNAKRGSLPPSPEFVEIVVEFNENSLKRRNTTPNRSKRQPKTALRGRGVEKQTKSKGSDSIFGLFTKGKKRSKLENVFSGSNGDTSTSNGSQTLPTKSTSQSRGSIPSFNNDDLRIKKSSSSTLLNKITNILNIGKEEKEGPLSLEQVEDLPDVPDWVKSKRSQSAVSATIEIHISENSKQQWCSEGDVRLIGPTIIGIGDEGGTYSSYGSQDTIVESYNVNSSEQRFLTIGIHDTIMEEPPEIRRANSNENCDHRREKSDGILQTNRRTSTPEVDPKKGHRRRLSSTALLGRLPNFDSIFGKMPQAVAPIPISASELPEKFSTLMSPSSAPEDEDQANERVDVVTAITDNPRYLRFNLFEGKETIHKSWHEMFQHKHMSDKAVKKQDAIYELIDLERRHCANLVFLQEGYRRRLIEENILPRDEVNRLIPDVIDALLIFHTHLLERLQARQIQSNEVESISDILAQEFHDHGKHTLIAIDAYTTFGSLKDRAERYWMSTLQKNQKFAEFVKRTTAIKLYREYDFRTIMTRIIARPARYGLLCESILKNEMNKFCPHYLETEKALEITKKFTARIDNNLLILQMNRKWDDIKQNFDTTSTTRLFIEDKTVQDGSIKVDWSLESICSQITQDGRRLFCIGEASIKSRNLSKMIPVTVICFDDIIVFLSKKQNGKYIFAPLDRAVLCLHGLILRNVAGHNNIMLIPSVEPILFDIQFAGRADFNKWHTILEKAIQHAPTKVRLNKKESDEYIRLTTYEHERLEKKQKEAEEIWMRQLVEMFERHGNEELNMFTGYINRRNDFATALQNHLNQMPLRGRPDLIERVKDNVRTKFKELRCLKTVPAKKLVDDMTQAKETMLLSYLQELEDGNRDLDSDGSASDSSGSGRSRPRRIKTFHGAETTSKPKSSGIRRHTTVPRMGTKEEDEESDDSKRERESAEEKSHNLPLNQPLPYHRECRRLIRDLEKLKTENISLKNELALDKLRITSLEKMRSTSSTVLTNSVETLEVLRKKEKDVREDEARRRKQLEDIESDINEKQMALEREKNEFLLQKHVHEQELIRRETEIANLWSAYRGTTRGDSPNRIGTNNRRSTEVYHSYNPPQQMGRGTHESMIPNNLIERTEWRKKK